MSGFEQEFPGKVRAQNVDATAPQAAKTIKALGFKNHGLVIRSARGKVLWKQADHTVQIEEARAAIQQLLRQPPRS